MTLSFGDYEIDVERRELRRAKTPVHVEPQVFDLLVYLVQNRDRVVSKDDLIASVWGGRIVSDSTLSSRINAARKAIGDSGEDQRLIRTLHRKGIRFVGAVREEQRPADRAAATVEGPMPELPAPVPERSPTAERRQLTVVSCELVPGQSAAHMDPEDLRDVMRTYHGCVSETAAHFGGMIGDTLGNTVLVYFGYPAAHEDDAEQAVRCGLELCVAVTRIAAVARLETHAQLQIRVGIATGLVVASDPKGGAEARERGIIAS